MKKFILLLLILFYNINFISAQYPGCPNINIGNDTSMGCNPSCFDIHADILSTGETNQYIVSSIPYAPPFPFTGGTPTFVGTDDVWSSVINLPFTFCFYGNDYNQIVVGANGLVSFDLSYAEDYCSWSFSASVPNSSLPTNTIFGAYHDIDPSVYGDINYAVLGAYPCRTFVINYNGVAHYDCNSLSTTQQIVIYEATNAIEIYIDDKPVCSSWNDGNALIGIQDAAGTTGITPSGRNTGAWSANHEAWRFTPNGNSNYVINWYENGNFIGTGATINVCPNVTTTYTGEVIYTECDGSQIIDTDDMTVTINNPISVTITKTDDNCGQHIGTATATPSPSGSYTYSWNTTPPQATATATNLGGGNYSVTVSDGVCDVIATVTINDLQSLSVTTSYTDDNCGQHTGTATANASGSPGVPTYEWSTTPPQTTATAINLGAGTYSVTVTDGTCVIINDITIGDTPSPTANITNYTDEMCGNSNGTATVTATSGTPFYSYLWDTYPQQNTATAINLPAGTYIVTVTDINNCSDTASVTIINIPGPIAIITNTSDENCGNSDGSATVTATGGSPQYSYTWNTNPTQYDTTVINLPSGVYTVTVTDANNCTDTATATINFIQGPVIIINSTDEHCGHSDGTATAIVSGGTGVYTYLWDTNPPQNVESINNLSAGFYTIVVSDGPCSSITTVEIVNIPGPVASFTVYPEITTLENAGCSFTDNSQGNISSWQWDFGDGDSSSEQNPYHTYTGLGTYTIVLTVTDNYGCVDSTKRTVIIKSVFTVYIPNSFTPDQDGLNETFGPVCNGIDKNGFEMFIFDRWGEEIYSTNDILKQWDGTKNNVNVPVGIYAYYIVIKEEYSDKKHEYIGKVNLIR